MFTFIKKRLYRKRQGKELLKAINHWNIAEETTYDEFRSFITEMKDICYIMKNMDDMIGVIKSIPKSDKEKANNHLTMVLINYYINVTKQTAKATDIIQMEKLQPETKEFVKDLMSIVHSTKDIVEDTVENLQYLMQI